MNGGLFLVMGMVVGAAAAPALAGAGDGDITVTILYDNTAFAPELQADWGFSCLIEGTGQTILFDAGTKPEVFFHNAEALGVDLSQVDLVVISHEHGDHTGALARVLAADRGLTVYHPVSFSDGFVASVEGSGATSER